MAVDGARLCWAHQRAGAEPQDWRTCPDCGRECNAAGDCPWCALSSAPAVLLNTGEALAGARAIAHALADADALTFDHARAAALLLAYLDAIERHLADLAD